MIPNHENVSHRPPFIRILRAASWGLSFGEAYYYGWRIFMHLGLVTIYAWPINQGDHP